MWGRRIGRTLIKTGDGKVAHFRGFTSKSGRKSTTETPSAYDQVGPAHSVSNLRQFRFYVPPNESPLHKKYRKLREETQTWSQDFWEKHNTTFIQEKEKFVKKILMEKYPNEPTKTNISAEEMSVFYRDFLNKNWTSHLNYNLEWQKRNVSILGLSLLVKVENILRKKVI